MPPTRLQAVGGATPSQQPVSGLHAGLTGAGWKGCSRLLRIRPLRYPAVHRPWLSSYALRSTPSSFHRSVHSSSWQRSPATRRSSVRKLAASPPLKLPTELPSHKQVSSASGWRRRTAATPARYSAVYSSTCAVQCSTVRGRAVGQSLGGAWGSSEMCLWLLQAGCAHPAGSRGGPGWLAGCSPAHHPPSTCLLLRQLRQQAPQVALRLAQRLCRAVDAAEAQLARAAPPAHRNLQQDGCLAAVAAPQLHHYAARGQVCRDGGGMCCCTSSCCSVRYGRYSGRPVIRSYKELPLSSYRNLRLR